MAFPVSPNIGDTHTEDDTLWTYGSNGWYSTVIGDANDTRYTCGPSIGSLNDVDLTPPPNDGDALVYDSATDSWIPGAAGATPGGLNTQIQFNDGGTALGGDADLTWNKTTNVMTVAGDVNLNDGGTFTTTLQTVTPTQNRTISFPDATGTVGLVAGSSGQFTYNNAGAYAGVSTMTFDGTSVTLAGRLINSYTSVASSPAKVFTGTWFTGGTSTTTKPHLLIEPSGATSTAWSTSGTGLGVNAASGFAGNLLDLQVNGTSLIRGSSNGSIFSNGSISWANSAYSLSSRTSPSMGTFLVGSQAYFGIGNPGAQPGLQFISTVFLQWSNSAADIGAPSDLFIGRDAANTLAQRNGTNAQKTRIYDTYTSATDYHRVTIATARATLTNVSGASVTATALIPAGAVVMGVTSKVTTALGTANGTTGYKIGTGADDDRWGAITGTAAGTTSDNRNWTAGTIECFPSATDVIVTATGGNFNGTGVIYLSVQYMAGEAD